MLGQRSLFRVWLSVCLTIAAVGARASAEEPANHKETKTELEGRWHPIAVSKDGQPWKELKMDFIYVIFSNQEYIIRGRGSFHAKARYKISYDATKSPKQLDMQLPAEGDLPARTKLAIYQLKDQELTVAWSTVLGVRPTSFEPAADVDLFRYKLPETSKLAKDLEGAWVIVSAEQSGNAINIDSEKASVYVFEEGTIGVDKGKDVPEAGKEYTLSERDGVLEIDFIEEGEKPGTKEVCRGIYEIKDGTLTICVGIKPETPRPTKVAAPRGSDLYLMRLKRKEFGK